MCERICKLTTDTSLHYRCLSGYKKMSMPKTFLLVSICSGQACRRIPSSPSYAFSMVDPELSLVSHTNKTVVHRSQSHAVTNSTKTIPFFI